MRGLARRVREFGAYSTGSANTQVLVSLCGKGGWSTKYMLFLSGCVDYQHGARE